MNEHIYIITYELKYKWVRNYNGFYGVLRNFRYWAHHIDNTWLVVSELNSEQIYNLLAPHINSDCYVLVTRFTDQYFGYMPQDLWDWINTHRELL